MLLLFYGAVFVFFYIFFLQMHLEVWLSQNDKVVNFICPHVLHGPQRKTDCFGDLNFFVLFSLGMTMYPQTRIKDQPSHWEV